MNFTENAIDLSLPSTSSQIVSSNATAQNLIHGGLPSDPNDKYFLTHCFACQAVAKPDQEYIRNYGGVVCFSCRAFWRRAHQKANLPNFICKRGGGCNLTVKSRRKCQKCRFDLCCRAGMTKEAILTEEQKQIRFRKMLQKRKSQSLGNRSGDANDMLEVDQPVSSSEGESFSNLVNESAQTGDSNVTPSEALLRNLTALLEMAARQSPSPSQSTMISCSTSTSSVSSSHSDLGMKEGRDIPTKFSKVVYSKIEGITRPYKSTFGHVQEMLCKELSDKLDLMNLHESVIQQAKRGIIFCLQNLAKAFQEFASKLKHFAKLHPVDRQTLINRNTKLFVQIHLAICLLMTNKEEIPFSAAGDIYEVDVIGRTVNVNHLRVEAFSKLFKPNTDVQYFRELLFQLKALKSMDCMDNFAILAFIVLFDFDKMTGLRHPENLEDMVIMNEHLYECSLKCVSSGIILTNLLTSLVKMAIFCSYNIDWDEVEMGMPQIHRNRFSFTIPYTEEEESWLKYQFDELENAFHTVTSGNNLPKPSSLLLLPDSIPFSKENFPKYLSLIQERMMEVLHVNTPNVEEKVEMISQDSSVSRWMMNNSQNDQTATGENSENVYFISDPGQFKSDYPPSLSQSDSGDEATSSMDLDEKSWMGYCNPPVLNNVQKVEASTDMEDNQVVDPKQMASNARVLISDPDLFKLNLLLIMSHKDPALSGLHQRYITLLRRRVDWMHKRGDIDVSISGAPIEILDKIFAGLNSLKEMSNIFQIVLKEVKPVL